jgi:hypothetical protein
MSRLSRFARFTLLVMVAAGAAQAAWAAEPTPGPTLELRQKVLFLSALPAVLDRPEVRPHLQTGLTTTFLLEVRAAGAGGQKARGGGMVEVRYEPWDETFLVSALGVDGRPHRETLPSFDRLVLWWRSLSLPVLTAEALGAVGAVPWQVDVRVSVIPFSRSEQREAQRWLSESIGRTERSETPTQNPATTTPAPSRGEALTGALDLLLATSIKRHSLVSYGWTLVYGAEHKH